jgi:hypothetical protein
VWCRAAGINSPTSKEEQRADLDREKQQPSVKRIDSNPSLCEPVAKESKPNLCRGPLLIFIHAGMPRLPSSLVELVVGEASWQAGPLLTHHAILLELQSTQLL